MGVTTRKSELRDQVSFKIAASTKKRIEQMAKATRRTKTFVIEEAINQYLALNEWQIGSIEAGMQDLAEGRVISQEKMEQDWGRRS
jgi:predicted transcriptional regulator